MSTSKCGGQYVPSAVAEEIVEALMRENDELLAENNRLRAEVERLRRELIREMNRRND